MPPSARSNASPMNTRLALRVALALACGAVIFSGCGDDGGGGGSDDSSTTGSGSGEDTTTMPPDPTTGPSESSGGNDTTGPSEDSSTGTPGEGSSGSGDSGSTGNPGECGAQMDVKACEATDGCVWVGNAQNGECLSADPEICPDLEMQQCQQHPACAWNNMDGMCAPV